MATPVTLKRPLARTIRSGHPWIYRDAVGPVNAAPGEPVVVLEKGRPLAVGLAEAGPIAVRLFSTQPKVRIGRRLFEERIAGAFSLRARVIPTETNAYRLIHGEGDRLPGVVCDRYGDCAVLKLDGEAIAAHLDELQAALVPALSELGIRSLLLRRSRKAQRKGEGGDGPELLWGPTPPQEVEVLECGMRLIADLQSGQKTGLFLDHRPYRARVRELSRDARVLNLYGYTGGFSVAAGLGGARHVTTVDVAKAAIELAGRTFIHNDLPEDRHAAVAEDVPAYLETLSAARERFDLVVADPPNFAPNDKSVPAAMEAYSKLHAACLSLLPERGLYLAGSCSSHIRMADFMESLREGARRARRVLTVLEQGGAPADHPRLLAFPEGDYLKVVLCLAEGA